MRINFVSKQFCVLISAVARKYSTVLSSLSLTTSVKHEPAKSNCTGPEFVFKVTDPLNCFSFWIYTTHNWVLFAASWPARQFRSFAACYVEPVHKDKFKDDCSNTLRHLRQRTTEAGCCLLRNMLNSGSAQLPARLQCTKAALLLSAACLLAILMHANAQGEYISPQSFLGNICILLFWASTVSCKQLTAFGCCP